MTPAFLACVASVLAHEGGFQKSHEDAGNWSSGNVGQGVLIGTNRGISAPMLLDWRNTFISEADMRALTREEAEAIYEARVWKPIRGDELPLPLAFVTLDAAVNSGTSRAAKWLQGALGVQQDGAIGAITISAAAVCSNLASAVTGACERRLNFLKALQDWQYFGNGWQNRVYAVQAAALDLINKPAGTAGKE
jgi:lysozyme family protein